MMRKRINIISNNYKKREKVKEKVIIAENQTGLLKLNMQQKVIVSKSKLMKYKKNIPR